MPVHVGPQDEGVAQRSERRRVWVPERVASADADDSDATIGERQKAWVAIPRAVVRHFQEVDAAID